MKKPRLTVSPTSLGLLEDCPRCFWQDRVKGIKRPAGPFPSLPSGMDKYLKEHFDRYRSFGGLPPELYFRRMGVKLFDNMELLNVWRNQGKGLRYTDPKSGVVLRGAIDELLVKNGKLIILDFKTRGFDLKPDTHEHYQQQMDLYDYLLEKNGQRTTHTAYLLFYIPAGIHKNGRTDFETRLVALKTSPKRAEKLLKKAIKILKGGQPKANKKCEFCKWRTRSSRS